MKQGKEINLEDVKREIGFCIGFYRKQYHYSVNKLCNIQTNYSKEYCEQCKKCTNIKNICSSKTIYRIEQGYMIKNDCVYHKLSECFNRKILFNRRIYSILNQYENKLKEAILLFSSSKLIQLKKSIYLEIKIYKNIVYVQEMFYLYLDIINYKLYGVLPAFERIQFYSYYINKTNKQMIIYLFQEIYFYLSMNAINLSSNEKSLIFYRHQIFHVTKMNELQANIYLLRKIYHPTITSYELYYLYEMLAYVQLNAHDDQKSYETLKKCLEILNQLDKRDEMKGCCYLKFAKICFIQQDYKETINWLMKCRQYNYSIGINVSLLIYSYEKLNQIDEIKKYMMKTTFKSQTIYEKKILLYYKMKYQQFLDKKRIIELEEYLIDLNPSFYDLGNMYKNLFYDDLKKYTIQTNTYKKMVEYLTNYNSEKVCTYKGWLL